MANLVENQQTLKTGPQTSEQVNPPPSITQQSLQQGMGSANTPRGAATAGGTARQAAQAGTPNQQTNARKLEEDKSRQSLTKVEATETAAPATDPQKAAAEKMDRIESLGATKGRIESLIQQTMQQVVQAPAPNLQVASDALAGISDPAARAQAQSALAQYSTNPTEQNLKAVYDIMGRSGVDAGISRMFQPQADTLAQAAQSAVPTAGVTMGALDLSQAGVDTNELAQALGVTPEELAGMDLTAVQQQIDAVQAQEFQSVAQLQSRLADPTLSPQERQIVVGKLKQAGAAAITGIEKEVDRLQKDIDSARLVNLAGTDYTIEELLGDDSISALVKQATVDPRKLSELMKDERTAQLGKWITDNKAALTALSESFDSDAADFLKVQDQLGQIGQSLGAGNEDLLKLITGSDLPKSMLSGDLTALQEKLAGSGAYQYLLKNPKAAQEFKGNQDALRSMIDEGFTEQDIAQAVSIKDELEADPMMLKLLGATGSIPKTKAELAALAEDIADYEKIDPRIIKSAAPWVDSGDLQLADIQAISKSKNPNAIFQDLQRWQQVQNNFNNSIKGIDPKDQALRSVFGVSDFSAKDLQSVLKSADPYAKQQVLSLFDANGDGQVSEEEMRSTDALARVKAALGVGGSAASIIGKDGQYNGESILSLLSGLGVDKDAYEKGVKLGVGREIEKQMSQISQQDAAATAAFTEATGRAEIAKRAVTDSPSIAKAVSSFKAAIASTPYGGMGFPVDEIALLPAAEIKARIERGKQIGMEFEPAITQAMLALAAVKEGPERQAQAAIQAAEAAKREVQKVKDARQALQNMGFNISSMNEEQLAKVAAQFGVI